MKVRIATFDFDGQWVAKVLDASRWHEILSSHIDMSDNSERAAFNAAVEWARLEGHELVGSSTTL